MAFKEITIFEKLTSIWNLNKCIDWDKPDQELRLALRGCQQGRRERAERKSLCPAV
jgi:hypothetical protein